MSEPKRPGVPGEAPKRQRRASSPGGSHTAVIPEECVDALRAYAQDLKAQLGLELKIGVVAGMVLRQWASGRPAKIGAE
jgi:hypothetical protein